MKRILVTGAGGFLGSYVVRRLLEEGAAVGAMVRPGADLFRLEEVRGAKNLTLLEGDITSAAQVRRILEAFRPEGTIHLAAAGVRGGATLSVMTAVNVLGLANLLDRPGLLGKRIVAAGSVFEYGPVEGVIGEETPCRPSGDYGFTKLEASRLLFRQEEVEWVLLRPFLLYGPLEAPGRLIHDLVAGLRAGREVPLSDGGQVRDFVFVADAARAFAAALVAERAARRVINVGSGRGTSVREAALAAAACAARMGAARGAGGGDEGGGKGGIGEGPTGPTAGREGGGGPDPARLLRFGALPRREGEAERLVAGVERARDLLHWEAATSLEKGLEEYFAWYGRASGKERARAASDSAGRRAPEFSLVVPCFNEEGVLGDSIPPLAACLGDQGLDFEVVLVDNGSTDGTAAVIDGFIGRGLPVVRVDRPANEGYGGGILAGLAAARGRNIGYMCADGQVAPEDVARVLLAARRAGPGALVKVRRVSRGDGFWRWFQSRVFNLICLLLFRTLTTDVNGTPKVMERSAWNRMALASRDWFIDAEVVMKAKKLGLNFVEVPVDFMPRQSGRSWVNAGTTLEFVRNILRYARYATGSKNEIF